MDLEIVNKLYLEMSQFATAPRLGRGVAKQKRAALKAKRVAAHRRA